MTSLSKYSSEQNSSAPPALSPDLTRALAVAQIILGALGVMALTSYLIVALLHLRSTYQIGHVAGSWMAQAAYWAAGTPYPPIGTSEIFGGTRYMPGFIASHAALVCATGEALVAGKLLTLGSFVLLLTVVIAALRRSSCPTGIAIALAAAMAMTGTGLRAGMTIRADALGAALATATIAVAVRQRSSGAVTAGVLAGLAFLCKQNSFWAPGAVIVWLLASDRRRTLPFVMWFGGTVAVGLAAAQMLSGGRFLDQIGTLTFAGFGTISLPQATLRTFGVAREFLPALWVLLPLSVLALALAGLERRLNPYHVAWVGVLGVTIATLQDFGMGDNQLLDLVALSVIVTGRLWVTAINGGQLLRATIAVIIGWVGTTGFLLDLRPLLRDSIAIAIGRAELPTFAASVAALPSGPVLSEHPAVPLARGELPIVIDAWMVGRIAERNPHAVRPLIDRIRKQDFTSVLLLYRLDVHNPEAEGWYQGQHFGKAVIDEIQKAYRFRETTRDGLHLHVPRGR